MSQAPPTIAVCGAGMIAGVHVLAAHQLGFPVLAVASRSAERSAARAAEWGCTAVPYDRLPAGADIVIVATPPAAHFDHVVHALERRAGVIVEKPLVTTLNEADRLVLIAERHGGRVVYAENLLFAPAVRRMLEITPGLGDLTHLSLRTIQSRPTWGDFLQPAWGGGVLFDLGVHPLALAVVVGRVCGAGEVVAVQATLTADDRAEGTGVDIDARVTLTYTNGFTASVQVSWDGPDVPMWDVQMASDSAALRLEILPTTTLECNGETVKLPEVEGLHGPLQSLGYVDQLRLTAEAFSRGLESPCGAVFGRWILEIVCACYVSAGRNGAVVAVPSGCDRTSTPWQMWGK